MVWHTHTNNMHTWTHSLQPVYPWIPVVRLSNNRTKWKETGLAVVYHFLCLWREREVSLSPTWALINSSLAPLLLPRLPPFRKLQHIRPGGVRSVALNCLFLILPDKAVHLSSPSHNRWKFAFLSRCSLGWILYPFSQRPIKANTDLTHTVSSLTLRIW